MLALYFFGGIVLGVLAGIALFLSFRAVKKRFFSDSLDLALYLVKIPKELQAKTEAEKDFKFQINKFEQLLSNLATMKKPFVCEVAVPHVGEEIHFFIAVPKRMSETAMKQVQGIWSGASVVEASDDYSIFNPNGAVAAAYVTQKENYALPVRTYGELEHDSFNSILGAFAKVNEIGEGAALQILMKPASEGSKKTIQHYIEALKRGEPARKVLGGILQSANLKDAFNPKSEAEKQKEKAVVDEEAVKILTAKISKPLFLVNARIVASGNTSFQANDLLDGILAGFNQFSSPSRNEFKIVKPKNPSNLVSKYIFRSFEASQTMTLTSEEAASIYHFPIPSTDTPKVKWLKSKEAPPPTHMPASGTRVGHSSFRGEERPVFITDEDRRRHIYAIGQTGTGKSTFMGSMMVEDINAGKGIAVIDPHGELVESILAHIPKERLDDVIYFNPGDLGKPLGMNMLDYNFDRPEEKTFIVNEMQNIFDKLFDQASMGAMFQQYMRNALLLLMEDMANEPATLIEVPRIFTDPEFRKRKLARIHNPVVVDFWEKEAVKAGGEASLANMTPYITSKFNNFISNDYMRPIIGQPKSAFNFREAMDSGKILLINLSKGRIGDINANLLGMIIIGKILMAALSRVDTDQASRKDFYLYIDEFQNFSTNSISSILSEARKYRLSLTIAHQFIAQLEEKIRDAVFGNVGSMMVFRVGATDAEFLVKQFEPVFDQNDLINIDNLNCYAKILINGETSKPFNMKSETTIWNPGDRELGEKFKAYSREKYGMDRQIVEQKIFERLRN